MISSPSPYIIVARIIKPHGIHGEVVLESFTDVEGRIENTDRYQLLKDGTLIRELEVETRRFFRNRHVLKFLGISTRTEAESLRNLELGIPEHQIGTLSPEHYFVHVLVGCTVRLRDGRELGSVGNIMKTGGVDILEVGEDGKYLIPFTSAICVDVDLEGRTITVDPPEGLLKLNAR